MKAMIAALAALLMLSACAMPAPAPAPASAGAALHGDPAHPAAASGWVRTELYFGIGPVGAPERGVSEADWRAFLDREVTPRFPSGLSVVDLYGQWQGTKDPTPQRLRSKLLILLYEDTPAHRAAIDAIRSAWKRQTGQLSVLRVTQPAEVSF
ncbi:DUF3574 domain-containing protein [Solimonas marina]|uniref:DUF3574 domain-containing protein n=1 Tax=Solimonas marina TaxID=2714601 RepID=A0A970B4I7_9GAMM|nr:DUF3574 domain-containing protein [Solimonas marina]NKF22372.1 DUF3574 domain-containing protein [Solimonas marina]